MTSVPKPLKFLRDKFDLLKEAFDKMVSGNRRVKVVTGGCGLTISVSLARDTAPPTHSALRCPVSTSYYCRGQGELVSPASSLWYWGGHQFIWPPLHQVCPPSWRQKYVAYTSLSFSLVVSALKYQWNGSSRVILSLPSFLWSILLWCTVWTTLQSPRQLTCSWRLIVCLC